MEFSRASLHEVPEILFLIKPYVEQKILLPKTKKDLEINLKNTWTLKKNREVIGTVSLYFFDNHLCEIQTFTIKKEYKNQGYGTNMIVKLLSYVEEKYTDPLKLFVLTYQSNLFERLSFKIVDKSELEKKVYSVCKFCSKNNDCNEIALIKNINS